MTRKNKMLTKLQLMHLLENIDTDLSGQETSLEVTILGGASIILMGIRERATADIDIVAGTHTAEFELSCRRHGITVDVVTIASTVDLHHCPTVTVFRGKHLEVKSVTATDLIKLKLERFRKQDPEDIYAIIQHEQMTYESFRDIVLDMLTDFIGNPRELTLSTRIVVEQIFPKYTKAFENALLESR
jgi:hypothetical protein